MGKRAVRIRFRHDTTTATGAEFIKGAEFELPSDTVAHNLYGDDIEIVSYADGEKYDLSLREQAHERKETAVDEAPKEAAAKGVKA